MFVVREFFVAKPGFASKLATMMKATMEAGKVPRCRVMTDVTGDFNTVVMETEIDSLADLEKRMQEHSSDDKMREKMKGYTDMYLTGGREIYRVW